MPLPAAGAPCPDFTVAAAVSGRVVSNESLKGHRAVIVVHGPRTTEAPKEVARMVRGKSMDPKDPILVTLVDLRAMGGLWRKVAEAQIKSTYAKLATRIPEGHDAADHILICPDWDGAIVAALGVEAADKVPVAIVLRADGTVAGVVPGPVGMGQRVLDLLG